MTPVSLTTTAFDGAHPGTEAMHLVVTVIDELSSPLGALLPFEP